MRARTLVAAIVLTLGLSACGASEDSEAGACTETIRFEGRVYEAWEGTDAETSKAGVAIRGECSDVGGETGVTYPEGGEEVAVGAFEGHDPHDVVGARGTDGAVYLYIWVDLPNSEAKQLIRQLGG